MKTKILAMFAFLALMVAAPAEAAQPGAIIQCQQTGQLEAVDPVAFPGVNPTAHRHRFYGAVGVDPLETSAELRAKPTSCVVGGNHSGYWMPQVQEDGVDLKPGTTAGGGGKHYLVYYRCLHSPTTCANMDWFPENTAFVVGNANASSAAENPLLNQTVGTLSGYRCGTGGGVFTPAPPTTCSSGVLVAAAVYGNCLMANGTVNLLTNGQCTNAGGQPVPRLQQYFRWWVGTGPVGTITLDGNPHWTLHADAFIAWEQATSDAFMAQCINVNMDCGTNPSLP